MPVTAKQVIDLLGAMVRIESVTPWLIPTGSGEAKIAGYIADWLDGTGAEVEIVEVERGRPNVLARLRGTGGGPTLCLNAHSDTVGYAGWPDEALVPRVEGARPARVALQLRPSSSVPLARGPRLRVRGLASAWAWTASPASTCPQRLARSWQRS